EYPTRVKSVTTYSNGIQTTVTNETRDPITSAVLTTRSISTNATEVVSSTEVAYQQPTYARMGAKSVNWGFANILTAPYETRSYRDTSALHTEDFLEINKILWTTDATVRRYNTGAGEYRSEFATVPWYTNRSYGWRGPLGTYGIFDADAY